jgi:dipeptidyl aminopeptidase/acylaminoacyl peptidase
MPSNDKLIAPEDLVKFAWVEDPQISPDGAWVACVKLTVDQAHNNYHRAIWLVPTSGGEPRQFTSGSHQDHSPRWSPDGRQIAFVSTRSGDKSQIYLIGLNGGEARKLTDRPQGATDPAWSPDGKRLAFLSRCNAAERRDEDRGLTPPADPDELQRIEEQKKKAEERKRDPRIITRLPYRVANYYLDDRQSHIYIVEVETDGDHPQPRRLTDGDLNYAPPAWMPDGRSILTSAERDPHADHMGLHTDILRISAPSGRVVRLRDPGFGASEPHPSPDGKWIAYVRLPERDSAGQVTRLAIRPAAGGGKSSELSTELDRSVEVVGWSRDGRAIFFSAGDHGTTGIYRVKPTGGRVTQVVGKRRIITSFDVAGDRQIAFTASAPEYPGDLFLVEGEHERRVTHVNQKWLSEKSVAPVREINYTGPDGTPLQGWVMFPPNFSPRRKWPLVVEIHGGPQVMWGPGFASMWHEWQILAAHGYVVFFCNPRGSDGYGTAFARANHSAWGESDAGDILAGVDAVVKRGYIDTRRIGVTGGSYGGFMTAWLVGHDQRFACAVSQRGVYDVAHLHGTTDISEWVEANFGGFPWQNAENYWKHSPLAYVDNIHTPLLILHSDNDFRAPVSDAEQLFTALRRLRRRVQFVRYPREGHELSRSGEPKHRIDRLNRIVGWFDKYLRR